QRPQGLSWGARPLLRYSKDDADGGGLAARTALPPRTGIRGREMATWLVSRRSFTVAGQRRIRTGLRLSLLPPGHLAGLGQHSRRCITIIRRALCSSRENCLVASVRDGDRFRPRPRRFP